MKLEDFSKHLEDARRESPEQLDGQLEGDCIQLLGQLEQMTGRLTGATSSLKRLDAINLGREMLVHIIEFAKAHFGEDVITGDLPEICRVRDNAKHTEELLDRFSVMDLFRVDSPLKKSRDQAYRNSGQDFVSVFSAVLRRLGTRFHDPATTAEWASGCEVFLQEFQRRW